MKNSIDIIMISALLQKVTVSSQENYKAELLLKSNNRVLKSLELTDNMDPIDQYFNWIEARNFEEDQIQNYSNIRLLYTLKSYEDNCPIGIATFNLNEIEKRKNQQIELQQTLNLFQEGQEEELFVKIIIKIMDLTSLDFSHFPHEHRNKYTISQKADLFEKFKQEMYEWKFKYDSLSESINLLTNELTNLSVNDSQKGSAELCEEVHILRRLIRSKLLNFLALYQQQNQDFTQLRKELDIYRGQTCIQCSQSLLKDKLEAYQNQIYDLETKLQEKDQIKATLEKQTEHLKQLNDEQNRQYQLQQQTLTLVRQNYAKSKQQVSILQKEEQKLNLIIKELNNQNILQEQKILLQSHNYLELEQSSLQMINIFLKTIDLYKQWNFEVAGLFCEEQKEKAELIKSVYSHQDYYLKEENTELISKLRWNNQDNLLNYEKQIKQLKLNISQQQLSFLNISIESNSLMKQSEIEIDKQSLHSDIITVLSSENLLSCDLENKLLKLYEERINISKEYQQFILTMKEQNQQLLENYKLHEEYCKISVEQNEREVANLKHKLADILNVVMEYGNIKLVEEMLVRVSQ